MKALKTISVAVLAAVSISVHASYDMPENKDQGLYLGLKTGAMDISFPGYDTDTPLAILGGYAFGNGLAIETEYTETDFTPGSGTGNLSTLAIYSVYRTPGIFTESSRQVF